MCIGTHFQGYGPAIEFGEVLRVKSTVEDAGVLYYEFAGRPNWAYEVCGFLPISRRCEVKMLAKRKKKSLLQRLAKQLSFGFKLL